MKLAPVLADDDERVAELRSLNLLDTPREPRFDRLTALVADVLDMPMVFVNLVDAERQWFKSTCGLDGVSDTPRDVGFCAHAIHEPDILLIPDASRDERFHDNPFVTGDFHLRFYAGVPIRGPRGKAIGTLCLVDTKPRALSERQLGQLRQFAKIVEAEALR